MTSTPAITRVAVVQMDCAIGDTAANTDRVLERLDEAVHRSAQIVIFPEAALTGYCFDTVDEAREPSLDARRQYERIAKATKTAGVVSVVGSLEYDDDRLWNSVWIAGPDGPIGAYRKTHLPFIGADKVTSPGDRLRVWNTPFGRLGVIICYDLRFPETARTLALQGADIVAVPTNWSLGAETAPEFVTRARAYENRVYVAACNRVGLERTFEFFGLSQIVDPNGTVLAQAGGGEEMLIADVSLDFARTKRVVIRPGEFEMDLINDRRIDLYDEITKPRGPGG